jgi:hypothetical protein
LFVFGEPFNPFVLRSDGRSVTLVLLQYGMRNKCFEQGCQMVYFQTKNPNLGKFCIALEWKMMV